MHCPRLSPARTRFSNVVPVRISLACSRIDLPKCLIADDQTIVSVEQRKSLGNGLDGESEPPLGQLGRLGALVEAARQPSQQDAENSNQQGGQRPEASIRFDSRPAFGERGAGRNRRGDYQRQLFEFDISGEPSLAVLVHRLKEAAGFAIRGADDPVATFAVAQSRFNVVGSRAKNSIEPEQFVDVLPRSLRRASKIARSSEDRSRPRERQASGRTSPQRAG